MKYSRAVGQGREKELQGRMEEVEAGRRRMEELKWDGTTGKEE